MLRLELLYGLKHSLVEHHLVDGNRMFGRGTYVELLPEQGHLLMLDAELENGSLGDLDDRLGVISLSATELDQLLPQSFELRLVRMETPQIDSRF